VTELSRNYEITDEDMQLALELQDFRNESIDPEETREWRKGKYNYSEIIRRLMEKLEY